MIAREFAKLKSDGIIAAFHGFDSWASRTRERTDRALDGACTADRHICRSAHLRPFPAVREAGEELAKCVAGVFEETTGVATATGIMTDGASNMRVLREGAPPVDYLSPEDRGEGTKAALAYIEALEFDALQRAAVAEDGRFLPRVAGSRTPAIRSIRPDKAGQEPGVR